VTSDVLLATGSALITLVVTPLFARFAFRCGLVVAPRSDRWHRSSTPLLGGAALAVGVLVALSLSLPLGPRSAVVVAAAAAAFALGLLDDMRRLAPATKLAGQVVIGSLLVAGGIRVEIVEFAPLAYVLTVIWVVALMNAINLVDNMDGLAAGLCVIAGVVLGLTGAHAEPTAARVAWITAGAALGFLVHNFHPARVFMGDAGSMLLGLLLAVATLLHTAAGAANVGLALLGPIAALALPIFDTLLVTTARPLAGVPISRGGRDHTSHRLAALGLSDRMTVLTLYGIAASFGALGVAAEAVGGLTMPLAALAGVLLFLFGAFLFDVDVYGQRSQPIGPRSELARRAWTYGRFGAEIALDVVLLTVAYYVAYLVRFEADPATSWIGLFTTSVPFVIGAQVAALVGLGTYRTLWRYFHVSDAFRIIRSITLGTALPSVAIVLLLRSDGYSRAVFALDWLFACALVLSARAFLVWLRHWFRQRPRTNERRVLVVGANDEGALAIQFLARSERFHSRAVGLLDDDPGRRYRRVAGVPVVGTTADLAAVVSRLRVDLVLLAIEPSSEAAAEISRHCRQMGIECRQFFVPV
jgi:UDP-GlcNAc:undecaprenyl-phosphate/decaprenyl-phosphate GlcNAc-1-phosphate transferase